MTAPFLGSAAGGLVDDVLSESECRRFGLVDHAVVRRVVDKGRRRDGRMGGEREEMALIGALSVQLLARSFLDEFPARSRARDAALDRSGLHVSEDLVSGVVSEAAR